MLRVVNFAHGEYLTIAMFVTYFLFHQFGFDPFLSSILVIPLTFGLGLLTERLLIRPTLEAPHVVQVFVTFALSLWLQNLLLVLFTSDFRTVRTSYATAAFQMGLLYVSWLNNFGAFVAAIFMTTALAAFLKYTYMGSAIRATAQDRRSGAADRRQCRPGLRRHFRTRRRACRRGLLPAVAAVSSQSIYRRKQDDPIAFVIVVLGGMGSIAGATLAGLLIGVVESYSSYFLGGEMKQFVYLLCFMLILAFRPVGFFGCKGAEVMDVT